ncbi:hypothetical protein DBV15_09192 [Temnothorax longispinosus]|uniref:Uncharacterized protein n=1 Tax=Temnothorax longispinosus TaxID=300112 RepID=A0A4S2KTE3_9HYME|nr:hypothetical protein DBV15_09192 [Temnothorax longispinosus]
MHKFGRLVKIDETVWHAVLWHREPSSIIRQSTSTKTILLDYTIFALERQTFVTRKQKSIPPSSVSQRGLTADAVANCICP